MKQAFNFSFLNLGCTKNLVDTQYLMGNIFLLGTNNPNYNIQYISDPYDKKTEYVFLNTCWFIKSGRDEMLATIEKLLKAKKKIYLLGCGLQYFKIQNLAPLRKEEKGGFADFLENSSIHYISRWDRENITIANLIKGYNSKDFSVITSPIFSNNKISPNLHQSHNLLRAYTNAAYKFEYLKIAEWCDNKCTFCIIPKLRGKQKSIPIENILTEVKHMLAAGIEEIILIAQDTSRYGTDLYGRPSLFKLLSEIEKIKGNFKYRLLYLYPNIITDAVIARDEAISVSLLKEFKTLKKFIPYFDIPFQHISQHILKKMGRLDASKDAIHRVSYPVMIKEIKKLFPKSYLRTNIIIGFPGETEKDFQELKKFIQESDFDNIALFEYHDEPLATSSKLPWKISDKVIRERFMELDDIVDKKITAKEKARIGKSFTSYVMNIKSSWLGPRHSSLLVVRPSLHAPEMDPYDTISIDQITKIYNDTWIISIGDKISYMH